MNLKEVLIMIDFSLTVLAGVATPLILGLIYYFVNLYKKSAIKREKEIEIQRIEREKDQRDHEMLSSGLRVLHKDRIIQMFDYAELKGGLKLHQKSILEEMYKSYKLLGGNGLITEIMEKIKDMPIL